MAGETNSYGNVATSTMFTTLSYKASSGYTKLCPIKDYPDLGGAPEQVETTTLDNSQATYVDGVQQLDRLEFTANYTKADYNTLKGISGPQTFKLTFSVSDDITDTDSIIGEFYWQGQLSVWVVGGGVNGVREMRISISASTEIVGSETELDTEAEPASY